MLQGSFSKEQADAFLQPLEDISRVGIDKILFEINDDTTMSIGTQTSNSSNFVIVNYKADLFKSFARVTQKAEFGVISLPELIGIMRIFPLGFNLRIDEGMFIIEKDTNKFIYYGCAAKDTMRAPSSKIKGTTDAPLASFAWNENMASLVKAMNLLKMDNVILSGDSATRLINVSVTNKQFQRYNNFSAKIPVEDIKKDFKVLFDKEKIQPVLNSKISNFAAKIFDKGLLLTGETESYIIQHAVTPLVK
jgi:hypothetical protein